MPLNLPNILTLLRVAAIPLLVVLFYLSPPIATWGCAAIFTLAAITDWLDGWLARRAGLVTAFGAFLDPVADKLIVATALVLLAERYDDWFITAAACVVIGREIVVSALREWMAQLGHRASVAVNTIAKFKTALQMIAITVLLAQLPGTATPLLLMGEVLLLIAVVLTLWSMIVYLQAFYRVVKEKDGSA
ncbi:CDP-diacylglycerol--glycerol-3-phosphate 3-phosphatidyltransferase [Luminiphilus syltensis NOR5-1B]|uniref:CDP-diacylglycerol--glycerol-3-phosphate 3-phosphatidyltransferase n=1 Tax=Luminiphilus syltensis NOR5-1B TaxID=565045 RepID=B8KYK0_9GAMM|nr:CDP-diacylglycerol--glycerol-3-phosphate 3-phosphatidyltransferase [Luminiphilus syltensis]EED35858.1 CDP-diacylglycerol--glycerol-3-phosphate 3-phosphatidyltransferase [Luminiphilus syltensis NOR5-1B]